MIVESCKYFNASRAHELLLPSLKQSDLIPDPRQVHYVGDSVIHSKNEGDIAKDAHVFITDTDLYISTKKSDTQCFAKIPLIDIVEVLVKDMDVPGVIERNANHVLIRYQTVITKTLGDAKSSTASLTKRTTSSVNHNVEQILLFRREKWTFPDRLMKSVTNAIILQAIDVTVNYNTTGIDLKSFANDLLESLSIDTENMKQLDSKCARIQKLTKSVLKNKVCKCIILDSRTIYSKILETISMLYASLDLISRTPTSDMSEPSSPLSPLSFTFSPSSPTRESRRQRRKGSSLLHSPVDDPVKRIATYTHAVLELLSAAFWGNERKDDWKDSILNKEENLVDIVLLTLQIIGLVGHQIHPKQRTPGIFALKDLKLSALRLLYHLQEITPCKTFIQALHQFQGLTYPMIDYLVSHIFDVISVQSSNVPDPRTVKPLDKSTLVDMFQYLSLLATICHTSNSHSSKTFKSFVKNKFAEEFEFMLNKDGYILKAFKVDATPLASECLNLVNVVRSDFSR